MYLEADIITSSKVFDALPIEAVINFENKYYGLLKRSGDSFKKVILNTGASSNGYVQILNANDFEPNSEFITKGAFNLIRE